MSNWVEKNATKSVIIYTIVVVAATWAAFVFIFDEKKVILHKAQISKIEAAAKEVEARNSVLITRLEYLTIKNDRLIKWLQGTPKTIPSYEKEILRLESDLLTLNEKMKNAKVSSAIPIQDDDSLYVKSLVLKAGTSFIDPKTNVVLGVNKISINKNAFVNLSLPDGKRIKVEGANPGESWDFSSEGRNYRLVLDSIDWAAQSYKATILEFPNAE